MVFRLFRSVETECIFQSNIESKIATQNWLKTGVNNGN
jgi:hypothetical protein